MKIATNGGGGVIDNPADEEIQELWYIYDVSGRLTTWYADKTYEPRHTRIRSALRRHPGESLEAFKARCEEWEEENK